MISRRKSLSSPDYSIWIDIEIAPDVNLATKAPRFAEANTPRPQLPSEAWHGGRAHPRPGEGGKEAAWLC